jgi:hypothetical protein
MTKKSVLSLSSIQMQFFKKIFFISCS